MRASTELGTRGWPYVRSIHSTSPTPSRMVARKPAPRYTIQVSTTPSRSASTARRAPRRDNRASASRSVARPCAQIRKPPFPQPPNKKLRRLGLRRGDQLYVQIVKRIDKVMNRRASSRSSAVISGCDRSAVYESAVPTRDNRARRAGARKDRRRRISRRVGGLRNHEFAAQQHISAEWASWCAGHVAEAASKVFSARASAGT